MHKKEEEENECNLLHVYNWIQFFVYMYNDTTIITTGNNKFEIKSLSQK